MTLTPGTTLGPYAIVSQLGSGGMGVVYLAHDPRLDRHVAIKLLPPDLTRDETAKQRFLQEVKAASALDHPNICNIHNTRTAWGDPDVSGHWLPGTAAPMETPRGEPWVPPPGSEYGGPGFRFFPGHSNAPDITRQDRPMIVDPPGGKVPLQPWATELRGEITARRDELEPVGAPSVCRCTLLRGPASSDYSASNMPLVNPAERRGTTWRDLVRTDCLSAEVPQ